jgi:hypothetical protein
MRIRIGVAGWMAGALALWSGLAAAQDIHACRDARGQVSYQTGPCGPGTRLEQTRTYQPIRDDPAAAARVRQAEAEMNSRARQRRSPGNGHVVIASTQPDARAAQRAECAAARSRRESVLASVGLKRTYALLQQLDDAVRTACKGQ